MRDVSKEKISYDLPEQSKTVNLAQPREEPKLVQIAYNLTLEEETLLLQTLSNYKDVFAWSYKDLKGVNPKIFQHTIPIKLNAEPIKPHSYMYNETFANKIKAEIDQLIEANFISV